MAYPGACRDTVFLENQMGMKWHQWFVEKSSWRESTLFVLAGALVTLVSLVMPWFNKVYQLSSTYVSAGEILAGFLFRGESVPYYTVITIAYLAALSLAAPFLKKKLAALFALPAFGLMAAMLYFNAVPFERFAWGLIVTGAGLSIILLGFFGKE